MTSRSHRFVWLEHIRDHVRDGRLDSHANLVAHILAIHYVNGGQEAWPSQTELAHTTGLSESTVRRALHDLEHTNLLEVDRGEAKRTSGNVYKLQTPPHENRSQ